MVEAGLVVQPEKCVVFYSQRSGNNWYKGKCDHRPNISIQSKQIQVVSRDTLYKYLGKSVTLSGEDLEQISEFIKTYKELVLKIKSCKLPLALKASAFNNMALAKILLHFYNTRLFEKDLKDIDGFLTKHLRELYELYELNDSTGLTKHLRQLYELYDSTTQLVLPNIYVKYMNCMTQRINWSYQTYT